MIFILHLLFGALLFAVLAAQLDHLFRLRQPGDALAVTFSASFFGILICDRYLSAGGNPLLITLTVLIQAVSAFLVWWIARRRARAAMASAFVAPQPRLVAEGQAQEG